MSQTKRKEEQRNRDGSEDTTLENVRGLTLRPGTPAEYGSRPYEVWSVEPDGAVILLRIGSDTGPFFVRAEEKEKVLVGGPAKRIPSERTVGKVDPIE